MRVRIKMRTQVRFEDLMLWMALFCISSYALLEHVSVSISAFSMVKMPLLYMGGICLIPRLGLFLSNYKKKKYFFVLLALLLLCAALMVTALVNRKPVLGSDPMRSTVRLILYMVELFALMIWISETGRADYVMKFLFRYVLVLVILTDVLFFTRVVTFYSGRHENYLIGTKFSVSYLHMDLLTLWFVRNNMRFYREGRAKPFIFWASLFILAVSIRVDCMTGVIGCVALFLLFMMLNTRLQRQFLRFSSPVLLVMALVFSIVFPLVAEWLVSLPFVEYLIEVVFGRDSTLTGRLGIFGVFGAKMRGHWLQGYGYGNGNVAAEWLFDVANAQNALLHWVLQAGIPVTVLLVVLMVVIFRQLERSPRQRQIMPLVVLVYVYIILGTVETTFSMSFILWLALIFMRVNAREPQEDPPLPDNWDRRRIR